jgi:SAM-dependent methyltransferase
MMILIGITGLFLMGVHTRDSYVQVWLSEHIANHHWVGLGTGIIATIIACIHLLYLWLVSKETFFRPLAQGTLLSAEAPVLFLLITSYFMFAGAGLAGYQSVQTWSLLPLILLYASWAAIDGWKMCQSNESYKRVAHGVWLMIDVSMAIGLYIVLSSKISGALGHHDGHLIKDILLLSCLLLAWLIGWAVRAAARDNEYVVSYGAYLTGACNPKEKVKVDWKDAGILELINEINESDHIRILDLGCGNGLRTIENLKALAINPKHIEQIVGTEKKGGWRESFLKNVGDFAGASKVSFHIRPKWDASAMPGEKFNIIFVSHVLYSSESISKLRHVADVLDEGGIVVARGYGPDSIFWRLSRNKLGRVWPARLDTLWPSTILAPWAKKNGLRLACNNTALDLDELHCCGVLRRRYDLRMKTALINFIEILHGPDTRALAAIEIEDIRLTGAKVIANDDLIYVLKYAA